MRIVKGLLGALVLLPGLAAAEQIGEVSTVFKIMGPNDKIVVEAFDDPKVAGVTCYLSRAKTGGVKGGLGLAEDRAEASIACRQVGPSAFWRSSRRVRKSSVSAPRWCSRPCRWCGSSIRSVIPWSIWSTATG